MDIRAEVGKKADILTKKLGFNVRFYGKIFSLYSISYATTVIRGIASTYLVTLWVAPEILGQFRYVITIYGLAGIFSFVGYGATVIKGLARGEFSIVKKSFKKILFYAPLGSLLLVCFSIDRILHNENNVGIALLIAAFAFIPYTLCSFYNQIYIGLEKIKKLTIVSVWSDLSYAVLFTLVLLKTHNLIIITLAYFLIDILIQGWFTYQAYRSIPASSLQPTSDTALPLGKHLNGISILQGITGSLGAILLQRFWGYTALASFSVAMLLPEQLINLTKTINGTLLQRFSRYAENPKAIQNIQRQFRFVLLISFGIFIFYASMAPLIIPLLFPQYKSAIFPSIIYALGIFAIPSLIGLNYFQAHSNFFRIWKFYVVSCLIQLITNFAFVPWLGNWGAIWSRVITRIGSLPFSYPSVNQTKQEDRI